MKAIIDFFYMGDLRHQEEVYLNRVNKAFLWLLYAHVPLIFSLPFFFGSSFLEAAVLSVLALSVPTISVYVDPSSRKTSCILGFATICISAILIHLAKGMIEFHFHIFVALAWLIIFGNDWVLITATLATAAHHLLLFFFLPSSVFNYEASLGIVLLHAAFVIAEMIGNGFVARKLFKMISGQALIEQDSRGVAVAVNDLSKNYMESVASFSNSSSDLIGALNSLKQVGDLVKNTAENAKKASNSSAEVRQEVAQGKGIVSELIEKAGDLAGAASHAEEEIRSNFDSLNELIKVLQDIDSRTQVINDIVFQTKLLSFNASVEAARAGEHGVGFAVVAEEIANLAQMSGNASKEITSLLASGVNRSEKTIKQAATNVKATFSNIAAIIEQSAKQATLTSKSFDSIATRVSEIISKLDEVTSANTNQVESVSSLNESLRRVISEVEVASKQADLQSKNSSNAVKKTLSVLEKNLASIVGASDGWLAQQRSSQPDIQADNLSGFKEAA